jgi:uncharacterized protein (TIGR00369 family)
MQEYRSIKDSQTTLTELMIPAYANFGGKIHGGTLLSLMDKVAYVCAHKHAGKYCVTVSVNQVEFLEPVEVGEVVSLLASVNYVGRSSMVVGIKVISENFKTQTVKHTNSCYFTMVAKDEQGNPSPVPGLILKDELEIRRFLKAMKIKELRQALNQELDKAEAHWDFKNAPILLKEERCQIVLP